MHPCSSSSSSSSFGTTTLRRRSSSSYDDIVFGGLLLASRIQSVCASLMGENALTESDLEEHPNLLSKVEKVQLVDRFGTKQAVIGTLYITTTHFMFVAEESTKETWVLHSHISSVERGQITAAGCLLVIRCKSFLTLNLLLPRDKECQDVYESLIEISQPMNIQDVYAFTYVPSNKEIELADGWSSNNVYDDYARLGLPNEQWTLSEFNVNYAHCDTYPEKLFVPKNAPKQILIGSSKFRSRGRLPVLAYLYPKNEACICRCSQPLAGFSARCVEDEELMQYILKTNSRSNVLYVVDTRPKINAMANKATGKGFENENHYSNMKFYFFGIENIHVMRSSLQKLIEVCSNRTLNVSAFLSGIESSGWLKHVRSVLEAAEFIRDSIVKGISIIVHCSDGWDRTAQSISIASLLLDPHYRTINGFQMLIERDWLSFGHKFTDRCGHVRQIENKEISPIFTQFLDCVWQVMQQFPLAFEFNERYLLTLNDHVYSCQFGTFLGNCEKDRRDLKLSERTYSLWGYVNNHKEEYQNPLYVSNQKDVLYADLRPQFIRFWRTMYNRFDAGIHPRESLNDLGTMLKDHVAMLDEHAQVLMKRINDLKYALGKLSNDKSPCSSMSMQDSGNFTTDSLATTVDNEMSMNDGSSHPQSHNQKLFSDPESGVDDPPTPGSSSVANNRRFNDGVPSLRLSSQSMSVTSIDLSDLSSELSGVEIKWQKLRDVNECAFCGSAFVHSQRKYHCWRCGKLSCRRCLHVNQWFGARNSGASLYCRNCCNITKSLASPL